MKQSLRKTAVRRLARLSFQKKNAKLISLKLKGHLLAILSLPAGHSCPFANLCLSRSHKVTGKITDGPHNEFRCYAVAAEALFPSVRKSRWKNFELLRKAKTMDKLVKLIEISLPANTTLVRLHQAGDFFSQLYFDAWLEVARRHPNMIIYGYTKALPFWVKRLGQIPSNFRFAASYGGTHDHLIAAYGLRYSKVVFSEQEAADLGLEIDHDDTHVFETNDNFATLLHGTQPPKTPASRAWQAIKTKGRGGYKVTYLKAYK